MIIKIQTNTTENITQKNNCSDVYAFSMVLQNLLKDDVIYMKTESGHEAIYVMYNGVPMVSFNGLDFAEVFPKKTLNEN